MKLLLDEGKLRLGELGVHSSFVNVKNIVGDEKDVRSNSPSSMEKHFLCKVYNWITTLPCANGDLNSSIWAWFEDIMFSIVGLAINQSFIKAIERHGNTLMADSQLIELKWSYDDLNLGVLESIFTSILGDFGRFLHSLKEVEEAKVILIRFV